MARFKPVESVQNEQINVSLKKEAVKKFPFQNLYGCVEGDMVYVNMEAVAGIAAGMKTLRDIGVIIDISGSIRPSYKSGAMQDVVKKIVDTVSKFDDDGIDLLFFAKGHVYNTTVATVAEVDAAFENAMKAKGAFGSTMPTESFKIFCDQLKAKGRAGTVAFLTDGSMDDRGHELKSFYENVLHTQFVTRDKFYCYAIEFGKEAAGALDVLDGLYKPDQGETDLFDLDSASDLQKIADVLTQVCGMSAVGCSTQVQASVAGGVKIDMVNSDLIEGGMESISGEMNKVMSFRVVADKPFDLTVSVAGYDPMVIGVVPNAATNDVELNLK